MPDITGSFPLNCNAAAGSDSQTHNGTKNKVKKLKNKLEKVRKEAKKSNKKFKKQKKKSKYQQEVFNERIQRCKAETELKYAKLLLQYTMGNCPPALPKSLVDPPQEIHDERDHRNP